jgi:hypothetical protein
LAADALAEYETSQTRDPRQFRGFWGAAQAAARAGNNEKVRYYYSQPIAMAASGFLKSAGTGFAERNVDHSIMDLNFDE